MSEELDIRSLSVTAAAKLLKVSAKTIRQHVRRGLPLVDLPVRQAGKRIDLIVYGAWLNQQALDRPRGAEPGIRPAAGPPVADAGRQGQEQKRQSDGA